MQVFPVINCPDFKGVKEKVEAAKRFLPHGSHLHIDVADAAFTFHKTWNDPTAWARLHAPYAAEVHLMVEHPEKYIGAWLAAGATRFIVHVETVDAKTFAAITAQCERRGATVVLSSRPETSMKKLEPYFNACGNYQVLAVNPGPSSQKFLPLTLQKIKTIRRRRPDAIIEVDGGMVPATVRRVKAAGADIVVSSSYIWGSEDPAAAMRELADPSAPRSKWLRGITRTNMESLTEKKLEQLALMANRIRTDIIKMVSGAGSGHIAGPLGMADIFAAFYFYILNHDPKKPHWTDRDRFVLSAGHTCPVQYATLAHAGYFPIEELKTLRRFGTRLQGHPHRTVLPGVETTSGPLGSGLSQAAGIALAARLDGKKWRTYCLMSDGEHEEGNVWEAAMFAGKNHLSNLTAIIDRNNIQIDGFTEDVMPLEPLREKYESFGWHVIEIDGHNFEEIVAAANEAKAIFEKPTCIIAHTIPGKGVDFMENDYLWHSKPFKPGEAQKALAELRTLRGRIKSEHE